MCAQTRPQFMLSSERIFGEWSQNLLTSREKIFSGEKFSSEEDRTQDAALHRTVSPTLYQRAIVAPVHEPDHCVKQQWKLSQVQVSRCCSTVIMCAGVNLETVDRGVNGCVVKSITPGGAVHKDGRLQPGDYVVSINNESLRRITNAQARAILRRTGLLSSDIRSVVVGGRRGGVCVCICVCKSVCKHVCV